MRHNCRVCRAGVSGVNRPLHFNAGVCIAYGFFTLLYISIFFVSVFVKPPSHAPRPLCVFVYICVNPGGLAVQQLIVLSLSTIIH